MHTSPLQILDERGGDPARKVFVEDLDSSVPAQPELPQSLDKVLKAMKSSTRVSGFLAQENSAELDAQIEAIIAKAVKESAAVSSSDLDSEMESEREQVRRGPSHASSVSRL